MLKNLTRFALKNLTRQQRLDLFNELTEEQNEVLKLAKELEDQELDMSWDEYYDVFDLSGEFDVVERPNRSRGPGMTLNGLLRQQNELDILQDMYLHVDEYGY